MRWLKRPNIKDFFFFSLFFCLWSAVYFRGGLFDAGSSSIVFLLLGSMSVPWIIFIICFFFLLRTTQQNKIPAYRWTILVLPFPHFL